MHRFARLRFIAALAAAVFFAGCHKDESTSSSPLRADSQRVDTALADQHVAAPAWLAERLPDDAIAYLRIPSPWGLVRRARRTRARSAAGERSARQGHRCDQDRLRQRCGDRAHRHAAAGALLRRRSGIAARNRRARHEQGRESGDERADHVQGALQERRRTQQNGHGAGDGSVRAAAGDVRRRTAMRRSTSTANPRSRISMPPTSA